jgi:hypothetical protein
MTYDAGVPELHSAATPPRGLQDGPKRKGGLRLVRREGVGQDMSSNRKANQVRRPLLGEKADSQVFFSREGAPVN